MNARRLASALALGALLTALPVAAENHHPELGKPKAHELLQPASFVAWLLGWFESWQLSTEPAPDGDPDDRPAEGPQSDPNG